MDNEMKELLAEQDKMGESGKLYKFDFRFGD